MPNKPRPGPYQLDPFQSQIVSLEWGAAPSGVYFGTVLSSLAANAFLSPVPCGIATGPGSDDWFVQISLERFDAQNVTNQMYINDVRGRTLTGDQSGLSVQLGGDDLSLFCNQNVDVVYVPGFSVDWQGLDLVGNFSLETLVYKGGGASDPGWIVGENCTIT